MHAPSYTAYAHFPQWTDVVLQWARCTYISHSAAIAVHIVLLFVQVSVWDSFCICAPLRLHFHVCPEKTVQRIINTRSLRAQTEACMYTHPRKPSEWTHPKSTVKRTSMSSEWSSAPNAGISTLFACGFVYCSVVVCKSWIDVRFYSFFLSTLCVCHSFGMYTVI